MPLFMDLHKASDYDVQPTVEDIKKNHIADLEVQHKHGVKFLQYWINEEAGLVFCLMEAPDAASCAAVHREAHGAMPCNIIELKGGDYMRFMGEENIKNQFDIVEQPNGIFDTGYRFFMSIDHQDNVVAEKIKKGGGRALHHINGRELAAFSSGSDAITCAIEILNEDIQQKIRIGISAGEPVSDHHDFFGKAIELCGWQCDLVPSGQFSVSSLARQLTGEHTVTRFFKQKPFQLLLYGDRKSVV